jgi:hypothetical protein
MVRALQATARIDGHNGGGHVIRKYIVTTTLANACGGMLASAQQGQRPSSPTPSPSPTTGAVSQQPSSASSTFVGCLYAESQIPGRAPNAAERAGVAEDFILANATMSGATTPGATPGAAGTSGTTRSGGMYKVEDISADRMKPLVGKRVEVMGRVDAESNAPAGAASPNRSLGGDAISLSEIKATSIKEVAGTCPATPSAAPGASPTRTPGTASPGVTTPAPTPGGTPTPGSPGANTPR